MSLPGEDVVCIYSPNKYSQETVFSLLFPFGSSLFLTDYKLSGFFSPFNPHPVYLFSSTHSQSTIQDQRTKVSGCDPRPGKKPTNELTVKRTAGTGWSLEVSQALTS
jgi:hypothetical protein